MRHTAAGWPAAELLEQPCGLAEQRAPTALRVFGLASLWYLSSLVAITTAKLSVSALRAPLLLCASQFSTATALTAALLRMHESPPPKVSAAVCRPLRLSTPTSTAPLRLRVRRASSRSSARAPSAPPAGAAAARGCHDPPPPCRRILARLCVHQRGARARTRALRAGHRP